jgi:hypothetical protein
MIFSRSTHINDPPLVIKSSLTPCPNFWDHLYAHAIMGNHDFNAVLWATPHPDKEGEFQRPHTKKNRDQHQTYLDEVENDPILLREMTEWLKSLPVFLEIGNANIVHACWYPTGIKTLQNSECLDENGCLTNKGWNAAADKSSPFYECIEILLKGPKENLPKGQSYPDAQGATRTRSRIAWWNENPTINSEGYASLPECDFAKQPFNSRSANSTSVKIIKDIKSMPLDKKIFIGHISLSGCPKPLSDRVISVDYFANTNQLVAFRMNNPQIPHQGHFISVPAQGLNRQQRKRVVK